MRNRAKLATLIEAIMRQQPRRHWLALFEARDIPCGPINDYAQVFADPQVTARDMVRETDHPTAGPSQDAGLANQDERDARRWRRAARRCLASTRTKCWGSSGSVPMRSRRSGAAGPFSSRHLQHLRQMHRAAARGLRDLLPAAEAVRHDQRIGAAARTAGSSTRSPIACDTANLPASKPNGPAMPQQPGVEERRSVQPHLPEQRPPHGPSS